MIAGRFIASFLFPVELCSYILSTDCLVQIHFGRGIDQMFITELLKNKFRLFGVNLIYEACFPFLVGPKRRMLYKYLFIFITDTGLNNHASEKHFGQTRKRTLVS